MNLNNIKTGMRLALGFGMMVVLLIALAGMAGWQMRGINTNMDVALTQSGKMRAIQNVDTSIGNLYLRMWGLVTAPDMAEKQAEKARIEDARAEYKKEFEALKAAATSQEDKDLLAKLEDAMADSWEVNQRILDMALKAEGRANDAIELLSTEGEKKLFEEIDPAIQACITYREKRVATVDEAAEAGYAKARWMLGIGALVALVAATFLGILITRSIVTGIKECVGLTGFLAKGDFTKEVPEAFLQQKDEIGDLTRAFKEMSQSTRRLITNITGGVQTLASSSTELSAVSSQTSQSVQTLSAKTATVAAAAEESSANTTSVAASMEQAATNLSSVASATEEMSATIGEVASNSEKARAISSKAEQQAVSVSALMQELGQAAQEIGKVTETITDISSQTNLLALNATIEAARAGAAGKGFAVVANEIKELAKQTATATEDIKSKIAGVQNSAGSAISDIQKITGVIGEVGQLVSSIATAIEEQAAVTKDVAGNIAQASAGVQDANTRVAQTATVSKSMAKDVAGVNAAAAEIRSGGEQVQTSANELSKLAEQLKTMVAQFKV